jgi:type IV pilus assembly protein PilB
VPTTKTTEGVSTSTDERQSAVLAGQRAVLRFLQREGRLSPEDAGRVDQLAVQHRASILELLEQEGLVRELELADLLAKVLRLPLVDLSTFPLDPQASRMIKEKIALKYEVVPLRMDEKTIEVGVSNPLDREAVKAVEFATGRRVQLCIGTRTAIREALTHIYRLEESLDEFLQQVPDQDTITLAELRDEGAFAGDAGAELPPVVKLADMILTQGTRGAASDIHVEPTDDAVIVRYRIDGVLEEAYRFPKWVQNALIGRLKVMAKLDITERRVPQDGRIQVRFQNRTVDYRVSSLPTHLGEKMTLRILDATKAVRSVDALGFNATDLERMREAARCPQGMILVTGPTGSGKTTTLYALIREVASTERNIVTLENPIEYQLKGINQVEVNEKQNLTFASVLRSVLRQDPDIILVGEIRDRETAQIAFQAAQTGHLVLSTLHTNDSAATITRLIDLGIEPYVIASSLHLVLAQRLVRKVCTVCSAPYVPSGQHLKLLHIAADAVEWRRGTGCQACRQSGYSGRVGVYEVMPVSPLIGKLIGANAGEHAIRQQAHTEGFRLLAADALEKLRGGLTTVEEILRVVQLGHETPRCPTCEGEVDEAYTVCPHCSTTLQGKCAGCTKPVDPKWIACPYCGAKPEVAAAGKPGAQTRRPDHQRTHKALIVDDELSIRHMLRVVVERADLGLTAATAQDGPEALSLAEIERPDIVVIDIAMPAMDGLEVCRRLRAAPATAHVPIIVLTAFDDADTVARAFTAGADDYVVKPYRREDLVPRIRRMLERTYGELQPAPAARPASED